MIKLFRKIRKNLLAEGKTIKYFKYAVGEIILVVIGILIALQINNWNEEKKNRANENYFMEQLLQELKSDMHTLTDNQEKIKSSIPNIKRLLSLLHDEDVAMAKFNLALKAFINKDLALKQFESNNATFEEIKSSGQLGLIQDKELRNRIVSLYSHLASLEAIFIEFNNFGRPFTQDFTINIGAAKYMDMQGPFFSGYNSDEELFNMRNEDALIGLLVNDIWTLNEYLPILKTQLAEMNEVVNEIENYQTN